MPDRDEVFAAERRHVDRFLPGAAEDFSWTAGPMASRFPDFRVRRVAPPTSSEPWVYVTIGAWEATSKEGDGLEFVLQTYEESPLHVELLAMVAMFHADPSFRLQVGRTMHIGRPWAPDSVADHLLVSLPYPYGPKFECCDAPDFHVRFLWLVPVTEQEAASVHEAGLEQLERRLEAAGVDVLDPRRPSLAP